MNGYIKGWLTYSLRQKNISIFSLIFNDCTLSEKSVVDPFVRMRSVELGDYSYVGIGSVLHNTKIGKFCSIADNLVSGLPNHELSVISSSPIFTMKYNGTKNTWTEKSLFHINSSVNIGNDVWIGKSVTIVNNVKIGDGCAIAAGAVVTKDVPPYAIVAGVPAKIIKYRFDKEVINNLLDLKWWDLPDEVLKQNIELFQTKDFDLLQLEKVIKDYRGA